MKHYLQESISFVIEYRQSFGHHHTDRITRLQDLNEIIDQARAIEVIEFGIEIQHADTTFMFSVLPEGGSIHLCAGFEDCVSQHGPGNNAGQIPLQVVRRIMWAPNAPAIEIQFIP
jgi:hypothetical protein